MQLNSPSNSKQNQNQPRGADYWTKRISNQEIPALCSTVRELEKLAKDDVSSLAKLGQSVMHDNALTSRILRVANSAIYNKGNNQVSTVSRAAVVLGFDTIRNICITAKMLSSLLETKNLTEDVYQRLLKLMAQSFQAAMFARMMLDDHDESLREEAFIASLLYRIGEVGFWSVGDIQSERLDKQLKMADAESVRATINAELGTSFNQLSKGIARNWGLGELLVKSLTRPDERTPEIRSIYMADQLADVIMADRLDLPKFKKVMQQSGELVGVSSEEFAQKVLQCSEQTQKLAHAYGAGDLAEFLPNAQARIEAFAADDAEYFQQGNLPNLTIQLAQIRLLTEAIITKTDFNTVTMQTLEGILNGVGMDRCGLLLLSPNRKQLEPRVMYGEDKELLKRSLVILLDESGAVFTQSVRLKQAQLVDKLALESCLTLLPEAVAELIDKQGFMIAPLVVEDKVLGVFYADRIISQQMLTEQDFQGFCHLVQLAGLSFATSMK
ncbi:HDOD domain-containing protein [Shewanella sp. WXL01]|uniref:HDOD domain-containing protein n=1 Tax=Shewanella sp. WXL01 TaxID=2709721 RepID=UPI0014386911|nr:HDOD domain-containing protein [Shewanella sp. WXL01]NKF49991.1 HDOD domain-containing protein [Shewanella sp. WXL01]